MHSRRILLTGATGFVGRNLLTILGPTNVRAAVRKQSSAVPALVEQAVVGGINEATEWAAALDGVDVVVHSAAHVHVLQPTSSDREQFVATNVAGTKRLAAQAASQGVKRFIFLSSIKVNGEETFDTAFAAEDAPSPTDDYGISKWQAEQALWEIGEQYDMDVIAIRTPLVYGPGVRANFLRLLSWVHRGIPLPLSSVRNRRSMVSVWNLGSLIQRIVSVPECPSRVLMVSDGEDVSTPELVRKIGHHLNRPARLFPIPVAMLKLAGAMIGKGPEVARICGSLVVNIEDTSKALDWAPTLSLDEGIARTADWYNAEVGHSS